MDPHNCLLMQGQYCITVVRLVLHVSTCWEWAKRKYDFLGNVSWWSKCWNACNHMLSAGLLPLSFPPSLGPPLPFKPTAQLQQTNHIVLSGILACFTAFHDPFCRHLFASSHSGSPRKSTVPYIPVWQVRRIHANPLNLAFLPRAVTGRGGPQRVILSVKQ